MFWLESVGGVGDGGVSVSVAKDKGGWREFEGEREGGREDWERRRVTLVPKDSDGGLEVLMNSNPAWRRFSQITGYQV